MLCPFKHTKAPGTYINTFKSPLVSDLTLEELSPMNKLQNNGNGLHIFVCFSALIVIFFTACSSRPPIVNPFLGATVLKGFEETEPLIVYNRENLFDCINGEAEVYLPLGFQLLYKKNYRKLDTGVLLIMEAYDMSSPEGAMDIFENYSQYGGAKLKGFTEQAWSDEYRVLFYNGGYFMQVMPDPTAELDEEPNLEEMVALAKQLDRALSQQLK